MVGGGDGGGGDGGGSEDGPPTAVLSARYVVFTWTKPFSPPVPGVLPLLTSTAP